MVGNLQFRPAFSGHAVKPKAYGRKRIGCAGKDELVHRRSWDEHADQIDPRDNAKCYEPALEPALALSFFLKIFDVFLGSGHRYAPFVFFLRAVIRINEHFMPAVGTDGLFPVR